jgi:hypothetical protein
VVGGGNCEVMRRLGVESFDSVRDYDYEVLNYIPELNVLKLNFEMFVHTTVSMFR